MATELCYNAHINEVGSALVEQPEPGRSTIEKGVDQRMNSSTPAGYIYIITCEGTNRIKIGYSGNPEKRLDELKTGAPGRLAIAYTWMAHQFDERAAHRALAVYRKHLEWFEVSVEHAAEVISKTLRRSPIAVIKPDELVQIDTWISLKWSAVQFGDARKILDDILIVLQKIHSSGRPNVRTSATAARKSIEKALPIIDSYLANGINEDGPSNAGSSAMLALCTAGGGLSELRRHPDKFVSGSAIGASKVLDQLLELLHEAEGSFMDMIHKWTQQLRTEAAKSSTQPDVAMEVQ